MLYNVLPKIISPILVKLTDHFTHEAPHCTCILCDGVVEVVLVGQVHCSGVSSRGIGRSGAAGSPGGVGGGEGLARA